MYCRPRFRGADWLRRIAGATAAIAAVPVLALDPSFVRGVPSTSIAPPSSPPVLLGGACATIPSTGFSVVYVDSQQTLPAEDGVASNAIDGNTSTNWVTQWQGASPAHPHEIRVDTGSPRTLCGFRYLPRQDGGVNGTIKDYQFAVSLDASNWTTVATGVLVPTEGSLTERIVDFAPVSARYVRLIASSEINGNPWTSAAEIGVRTFGSGNAVPPQEVLGTLLVNNSGGDVVLGWPAVSTDMTGQVEAAGVSYRVYAGSTPTFVPGSPVASPTSTAGTLAGLFADNNSYYFLVSAVSSGGVEGNRKPSKVTTPPRPASIGYAPTQATVGWTAAAPGGQVAGHRVLWGPATRTYTSAQYSSGNGTGATVNPFTTSGTSYFSVLAQDTQGNYSAYTGQEVSLTLTGAAPPGITASVSPSPNGNGWHNSDATVTFTCSGASGEYNPNSHQAAPGAVVGFTNPQNAWDPNNETSFASCGYNDNFCGGDFSFPTGQATGYVKVVLSRVAGGNCLGTPLTEAYYSLNAGQSWQLFASYSTSGTSTQSFSSASLGLVDLAQLRVRVLGVSDLDCTNGTAKLHDVEFVATSLPCPPPTIVTSEGASQVAGGTVTAPGRSSATASVTVSLDRTAPMVSGSATPAPNAAGWNNGANVQVAWDCQDALSGIATCSPTAIYTAEGVHAANGNATDLAGNAATPVQVTVRIDRTAPAVTITAPAAAATLTESPVTIAGTITEALSGATSVTCNGQPGSLQGNTFSCSLGLSDGSHTVTVQIADLAGNLGSAQVSFDIELIGAPPDVTIASPVPLTYTNQLVIDVSGTVSDPEAVVVVGETPAVVTGNTWIAEAVPLREGNNLLTATATDSADQVGTATVLVTRDTHPPVLTIEVPEPPYDTTEESITVAGMVNDIVVGTVNAGQAIVTVNGLPANVSNRHYLVSGVPLAEGPNTITVIGRDTADNEVAEQITVTRDAVMAVPYIERALGNNQSALIGTELAPPTYQPLVARLRDEKGDPVAGEPVIFKVVKNDGSLRCTTGCRFGNRQSGRSVAVLTDVAGDASVIWTLGNHAGAGNQVVEASAVGFEGTAIFTATGLPGVPAAIHADMGNLQAGTVGQPLPRPFVAVVTDEGHNRLQGVPVKFTIIEGGGTLPGQGNGPMCPIPQPPCVAVDTNSDGLAAVVLTLGPGEELDSNVVEASVDDGADGPIPPATFVASAMIAGSPGDTRITGVVLDNTNLPVPGVTIRVDSVITETDSDGQFVIAPAPVGHADIFVDSSTADRPGDWASLHFEIVTVAGRDNTVGMPIYILPLNENRLQVSETLGGTITLEEMPGFRLEIEPGSVTFPGPGNSHEGEVWVTVVHADKMPMPPSMGGQGRFMITVQPAGAHIDPPARLTLPNTDGLAPGEITELFSFDHDLGQFVSIGTGTVSEDGGVITSDPSVGIFKSGWHGRWDGGPMGTGESPEGGLCPPSLAPCTTCSPCEYCGVCDLCVPMAQGAFTLTADGRPGNTATVINRDVSFGVTQLFGQCSSPQYTFHFGDGSIFHAGSTPTATHQYLTVGSRQASVQIACGGCTTVTESVTVNVVGVEIEINNTPAEDDDLVRVQCAHPARRFLVASQARVVGNPSIDVAVELTNPDGRVRFPVTATAPMTLPRNGDWRPFAISGESSSVTTNDVVIEPRLLRGTSTSVACDSEDLTVYSVGNTIFGMVPGNSYSLAYPDFTVLVGAAVYYSVTADVLPSGINCALVPINALGVGLVQNLISSVTRVSYANPILTWNPGVAPGTVARPVPTSFDDVSTKTGPFLDSNSTIAPLYAPSVIVGGCPGSGSLTTNDTPQVTNLQPQVVVPAQDSLGAVVGTLTYDMVEVRFHDQLTAWTVGVDNTTTDVCAGLQRDWEVNVSSITPQPASVPSSASIPSATPVLIPPFARSVVPVRIQVNSGATTSFPPHP